MQEANEQQAPVQTAATPSAVESASGSEKRLTLVILSTRLDVLEARLGVLEGSLEGRLGVLEGSATHDQDLINAVQQTLAGVQQVPDQVRAEVEPQLVLTREVLAALAPLADLVTLLKARPEVLAQVSAAPVPVSVTAAEPAPPTRHMAARPPASAAPTTGGKQVEARAPSRPPASAGRSTGAPAPHVRHATFGPPPGAGPEPVAPVGSPSPISGDLVPASPKARLAELLAEGKQLVNGLDPTIAAIVNSQLQSLENNLKLVG